MYRLLIYMLSTIRRYCTADTRYMAHTCWPTTRSGRKNRHRRILFRRGKFDDSLVRPPPTQVIAHNTESLQRRSAIGTGAGIPEYISEQILH